MDNQSNAVSVNELLATIRTMIQEEVQKLQAPQQAAPQTPAPPPPVRAPLSGPQAVPAQYGSPRAALLGLIALLESEHASNPDFSSPYTPPVSIGQTGYASRARIVQNGTHRGACFEITHPALQSVPDLDKGRVLYTCNLADLFAIKSDMARMNKMIERLFPSDPKALTFLSPNDPRYKTDINADALKD